MARVESTFHTAGPVDERLTELGWEVKKIGTGVVATQGSQIAMRALGGYFISLDKLPKKLEAEPAGDGFDVRVEETVGVGLMSPLFKKRYAKAFSELEAALT